MANKRSGLATVSLQIGLKSFLLVCREFQLSPEHTLEDGSGVSEQWESNVAVKSRWTGTGTFTILTTAAVGDVSGDDLIAALCSADISGAFSMNNGRRTYSGNVLIQSASLRVGVGALQTVDVTLQGQGALTVSVAS